MYLQGHIKTLLKVSHSMKTFFALKIASIFLTLGLLVSFTAYSADFPTAPAWQLKTQSGKNISLSDYHGQPVILHFWATWCPYCKKLQPKLVEFEQQYKKSDIHIVAISINEEQGTKPQDEIQSRGYHFITAVNGESVADLYGVRGTPTTFFINRQGKAIYKSTSSDIDNPKLALAVKEIIKR